MTQSISTFIPEAYAYMSNVTSSYLPDCENSTFTDNFEKGNSWLNNAASSIALVGTLARSINHLIGAKLAVSGISCSSTSINVGNIDANALRRLNNIASESHFSTFKKVAISYAVIFSLAKLAAGACGIANDLIQRAFCDLSSPYSNKDEL